MRIIKDWRLAMIFYIVAIVLFIVFDFSNNLRPYHQYFLVFSAVLLFLSIVYQLIQRNWGLVLFYSAMSFGVTMAGFVALMVTGFVIESSGSRLFKNSPIVYSQQDYIDEFVNSTKLPFPESARFLAMDDTVGGFGFENEYDAHCLIKLSKLDYNQLRQQIKANPDFVKQNTGIDFEVKLVKNTNPKDFSETYMFDNTGSSWYTISFHNDQQTVGIKYSTY